MEEHYPIMDKTYKELIVAEIEDEGSSIINAAAKTFYKAKGELITYTIGTYLDARFTKRIERFAQEESLLSPAQVKHFYEDIDENKLDLLFDLLDKTRSSTYDFHAKTLSKIYIKLLKDGKLNYYESSLLSNILTLNKYDFDILYKILKDNINNNSNINYESIKFEEISALYKFQNIGLLPRVKGVMTIADEEVYGIDFRLNDYSKEFLAILTAVNDEQKFQGQDT